MKHERNSRSDADQNAMQDDMHHEYETPNGATRLEDDVRLTAYAFDELDGDDRAAVEALLERDAAARAHVDELRALGASLRTEWADAPSPAPLSAAQRAAIEAAAAPARAPRGRLLHSPLWKGIAALAATGLGLASIQVLNDSMGSRDTVQGDDHLVASAASDEARPTDQLGYGPMPDPSGREGAASNPEKDASGARAIVYDSALVKPEASRSADGSVPQAEDLREADALERLEAWVSGSGSRPKLQAQAGSGSDDATDASIRALGYAVEEDVSSVDLEDAEINGNFEVGPVAKRLRAREQPAADGGEASRPDEEESGAAAALVLAGGSPRGDGVADESGSYGGQWRGPGDTVPPSEATASNDLGAPTGSPASPGLPASGAAAPGRAARSLEGLGYSGGLAERGRGESADEDDAAPSLGRRGAFERRQEDVLRDDRLISASRFQALHRAQVGNERYDALPENPFVQVLVDARSTFSVDVDTASYANVRRFLRKGQLPPRESVRVEELVNAFSYAYPAPTGEHPFAVHAELVRAPWSAENKLLRIGLQGALPTNETPKARNLVFLVDVSGSMSSQDKLPLVQASLELLVHALRPHDTIGIVTYSGTSGIVLQPTAVAEKEVVLAAIQGLRAGGSTNGAAGIVDAYRLAQEHFVEDGVNRVVLASDGDFNVGVSDRTSLERLIEEKRRTGVFLSVLGFGTGNLKDSQMEALADKGNGNYSYIDSRQEARKVLVRNLDATLETIAKDVKLQLEFNPKQIEAFRLIGYENRKLAHRDFLDPTKDAGEIGAGHSVTALYELVPVGASLAGTPPLKYQQPGRETELTEDALSGEALTISLNYKRPDSEAVTQLELPVEDVDVPFKEASQETRFAAAVASFGMILRGSEYAGGTHLDAVYQWAEGALGADPDGDRREFLKLVDWAMEVAR